MPDVLQHCFGTPGTGGPATALARLLDASDRDYPVIWQTEPAGGLSLALLRRFVREIRAHRPELIHVRGLGNEGFHAALAARIAGVPRILVSIHGTHRDLREGQHTLRRRIVTRILEPLTLRMASAVVTVCRSAAARDFLDPVRGKLREPVPNGVALPPLADPRRDETRAALGIAPGRPMLIAVSRLTVEKGYGELAQALRQLDGAGGGFDLVVVGGGDQDGAIRALFDGLEAIRVQFLGHRDDVDALLAAADGFVFPTWHENLSNALLEAMAQGLAVIATDVGGNREVLEGGGGMLVPARQPDELARAIEALISDPERRSSLGREARANVERNYSVQRMVAAWESAYADVIGQRA